MKIQQCVFNLIKIVRFELYQVTYQAHGKLLDAVHTWRNGNEKRKMRTVRCKKTLCTAYEMKNDKMI